MTLTADERKRKRKLERELADLRAKDGEPLTLAEIREMTPEQVEEEWERIKPTLARLQDADGEERAPASPAEARRRASRRISSGLDDDPAAVRRRRRGMDHDDQEGDDDHDDDE